MGILGRYRKNEKRLGLVIHKLNTCHVSEWCSLWQTNVAFGWDPCVPDTTSRCSVGNVPSLTHTHVQTISVAQNSCLCQYFKILKNHSYHISNHRTASSLMVLWESTNLHISFLSYLLIWDPTVIKNSLEKSELTKEDMKTSLNTNKAEIILWEGTNTQFFFHFHPI